MPVHQLGLVLTGPPLQQGLPTGRQLVRQPLRQVHVTHSPPWGLPPGQRHL
ncbi:hypothetical protein [Kytococcus sedentarius]|uniref:hypothetical protein n=1 Tax=Kytococcus sedentarius TaxID=1276 RepID=UPI0035BBF467